MPEAGQRTIDSQEFHFTRVHSEKMLWIAADQMARLTEWHVENQDRHAAPSYRDLTSLPKDSPITSRDMNHHGLQSFHGPLRPASLIEN